MSITNPPKPVTIINNATGLTKVQQQVFHTAITKENFTETLHSSNLAAFSDNDGLVPGNKLIPFITTIVRQLERLQEAVRRTTAAVRSAPYLNSPSYIKDIDFTNGVDKVIAHYLNRPYSGWRLNRIRGGFGRCHEVVQNDTTLDSKQITLAVSATFTADLEIW
jgi:hypothetical protein